MRRSLLVVVIGLMAALTLVTAPGPAGATVRPIDHAAGAGQEPDAPADDGTGGSADDDLDENPEPAVPDQNIIPRPNSGQEPTEAGDRGGALQILVLVALVAGVGAMVVLVVRDARRSRARTAEPERTN